jgi:uncharacterized protein
MAALPDTRMPGVITQEIPTLPPSIGAVPSAVPCFIGYTEKAEKEGEDVTLKPVRVRNMRDYENWFGTSPNQQITIDLDETVDESDPANPKTTRADVKVVSIADFKFRMHYAMQLYYANGGGPAFIISAGKQSGGTVDTNSLVAAIEAAKKARQITIMSFPDAVKNVNSDNYYGVITAAALQHCDKMKNRVLILDVNDEENDNAKVTANFRSKVPQSINQKYAAAYYPMLATTLDYKFDDQGVEVRFHRKNGRLSDAIKPVSDALDAFNAANNTARASVKNEAMLKLTKATVDQLITATPAITPEALSDATLTVVKKEYKITEWPDDVAGAFGGADAAAVKTAIEALVTAATTKVTTDQQAADAKKTAYIALVNAEKDKPVANSDYSFKQLATVKTNNNLFYNRIREAVQDLPVVMPPSPAIAGLMVQTDATQGVWKAPANAGLAAVISPTVDVDDDFHADLNVDASSGKSVNAIRAYEGKGILVFGARTLAGNDLEWRYISVRRTFCFIEDSVGQAMQDFVFAPNTRDTWIKVKAMISNFLIEIWKAGGLFGNTTNEAFQVNVGLPETMTDVDILEGRMIVEIKLRVARPAEFIILRYEHKFQANAA